MIRQFKFKGGPFDGWEGEYVANHQEVIKFGPPGERVYCYRRQTNFMARRGKVDHFRYDRHLTKLAMLEAGFSPADADLAGDGVVTPTDRKDAPAYTQKVSVEAIGDRWLLIAEDVIIGERPKADITCAADAKAWVAEVMLPNKEAAR